MYQSRISKYRAELLRRLTPSEIEFKNLLDENSIKYVMQKGFCTKGLSCIVDFYIPKYKCCVEIDGGYHKTPEQRAKDNIKNHYLTKIRNFRLIRIDNELVLEKFNEVVKAMQLIKRGEAAFFQLNS